jgi:hypothetical protein
MAVRCQRFQPRRSAPGQSNGRLSTLLVDDAHFLPRQPHRKPRSKCFRTRLLGGKTFGIGCRTQLLVIGSAFRLVLLDRGEDPCFEALAKAFEGFLDPPDVAKVSADADDHDALRSRQGKPPAPIHRSAHMADRGFKSDENRFANKKMADVEFIKIG